MRARRLRILLPLVAALAAALSAAARPAQEPQAPFATVELVGWDLSSFDAKVREAASRAGAPGAGEAERRALAEALAARADFFWGAGVPHFYRHALGDYRHVLRLRPGHALARRRSEDIVSIYKSMARPVPTNGETKSGGAYVVEVFEMKPKPLAFEAGKVRADDWEVTERVSFVYGFAARAGQRLSVEVVSEGKAAAVFDLLVREPGGARTLFKGVRAKSHLLPSEGDYLIRVYTKGGAAGYELKAELR